MEITLKNLEKATAQQVFNQVSNHLLTQNKRSFFTEYSLCAYRGENGLKCAAGCLIADDEYEEDMEGIEWWELINLYAISNKHSALIGDLQVLHDSTPVDEWDIELMILAKKYSLEFNK